MQISEPQLNKFILLYQKNFGVRLEPKEALPIAEKVARIYRMSLISLSKNENEKYGSRT